MVADDWSILLLEIIVFLFMATYMVQEVIHVHTLTHTHSHTFYYNTKEHRARVRVWGPTNTARSLI